MTTTREPTTARPQFAFLHADNRVGAYKYTNGTWNLVTVVPADAGEDPIRETAVAFDADIRDIRNALHLLDNGDFPTALAALTPPTALATLTAEVALLRRRAEARRYDAAMSDMRHDNGARELDARAEAIEYAIRVFEQYTD